MPHVEGSITIGRCPEDVFDFVADERNEPRYNTQMVHVELLTDGALGIGSKFHAVMKTSRGRVEMTIEWTAFERPRVLGSSTQLQSMDITGLLTFEAVPEGTRMRWSWELQPHGLLRLIGPVVGHVGARQESEIWSNLKRVLEEQPVPEVVPSR